MDLFSLFLSNMQLGSCMIFQESSQTSEKSHVPCCYRRFSASNANNCTGTNPYLPILALFFIMVDDMIRPMDSQ